MCWAVLQPPLLDGGIEHNFGNGNVLEARGTETIMIIIIIRINNTNNLATTRQAAPSLCPLPSALSLGTATLEGPNSLNGCTLLDLPQPKQPLPEIAELSTIWPIPRGAIQRPRLVQTRPTHPTRRHKHERQQATSDKCAIKLRSGTELHKCRIEGPCPPPHISKLDSFPFQTCLHQSSSVRVAMAPA